MPDTLFDTLLTKHRTALVRYVRYRIPSDADTEDLIQEISLAAWNAYRAAPARFSDTEQFLPFVIGIAKNKISDYFRRRAKAGDPLPLDSISELPAHTGNAAGRTGALVREILSGLSAEDRQILYLSFWLEYPQAKIAALLGIPPGTVKSRLFHAKRRFRDAWPYPPAPALPCGAALPPEAALSCESTQNSDFKGDNNMKPIQMPSVLPAYTITPDTRPPFPVIFEELSNWFIRPVPGETVVWASYDCDVSDGTDGSRVSVGRLTETTVSHCTQNIVLHGIRGAEIETQFFDADGNKTGDHLYYAQLSDTHCRWLGECYTDSDGAKHFLTFLDGDDFMREWGIGEDNCGMETHPHPRGLILRTGSAVTVCNASDPSALIECQDIVGRYSVTLGKTTFDTVLLMGICANGALTEQYIGTDGRTVLWRRFNRFDWAKERYGKPWTELLPENERLDVNGVTYVHWYDCISSAVLRG